MYLLCIITSILYSLALFVKGYHWQSVIISRFSLSCNDQDLVTDITLQSTAISKLQCSIACNNDVRCMAFSKSRLHNGHFACKLSNRSPDCGTPATQRRIGSSIHRKNGCGYNDTTYIPESIPMDPNNRVNITIHNMITLPIDFYWATSAEVKPVLNDSYFMKTLEPHVSVDYRAPEGLYFVVTRYGLIVPLNGRCFFSADDHSQHTQVYARTLRCMSPNDIPGEIEKATSGKQTTTTKTKMIAPGTKAILKVTKANPTLFQFKISVWIITFFAYMTYHLSRKPISVAKAVLHCDNNTNSSNVTHHHNTSSPCVSWAPFDEGNYKALLASLDYAYLFAYAFGMFLSGHIAERTNLRYFLTFGMLGSGLFTALFGCGRYWGIHHFAYYLMMQIVAGLLQSTGWPSVVAALANWFGKGRRGLVMGVWNAHTSLGNILGGLIGGAFVDYNWGLTFIVPGAIIAGMGVIVFFFLIPYPEEVGLQVPPTSKLPVTVNDVTREESDSGDSEISISDTQNCPHQIHTDQNESDQNVICDAKASINREQEEEPLIGQSTAVLSTQSDETAKPISIWKALRIPGVVEFALCLFFAKLVSYTFLFWLPFYISNVDQYSGSKSADLATVFDVGGIIGSVIAGLVSDHTRGPGTVCTVSFILAAPALFVYQSVHIEGHTFLFSVAMLLLCGALVNGPYGLITTAVSADLGSHESLRGSAKALSTVTAIIDGTGSMGAALGPLLTGIISSGHNGWHNVFYMLIAADVLAMLCMTRIVFKEIRHWCMNGLSH